jgi:hypothetical protein
MKSVFVAAAILSSFLLSSTPAAAQWQAGVAKASITPEKFMWMSGYASRTRPADAKLTDLWAKALVVQDSDGGRGVLVTLDPLGLDCDLSLGIRQEISRKHKLDMARIVLASSHTHSGPVVAKNLRPMHYLLLDDNQKKLVDEYAKMLHRSIVEIVGQALEKLAPCEISQGSGMATFAANRRNNPEAQIAELRLKGMVRGPSDHDVPVLAVKDAQGKLLSVVFGYACHATVLDGYGWCGDYPGYAQIEIEKANPGAVAMFWAGCGGDQNPLPRRKIEYAQEYGKQLGQAVQAVLGGEMKPVKSTLAPQYVEIDLPLAKLPTKEDLQKDAGGADRYVASRAKYWLDELAAGRPMSPTYPYPIARWQLGDEVEWLFLGGEVVVDFALRLKSESRGKNTWVAGYSNDVMAYIPSRRVLTEGGYEGGGAMVYYGLPTVWAETVEQDIVQAVKKLQGK